MPRRDRHQIRRRKRAVAAAVHGERLPPAESTGPVELFRAGWWREVKVRFVQILGLLMAPAALWGASDAAFAPAEILGRGGDVVSWPVRYGTAAFLFAVGVGAGVGVIVYGWCYVTRAVWDPVARRCLLTLAGPLVPLRLDVPAAREPRWNYRDGVSRTHGPVVNAPYYSLRLPGRRLPLLVDGQGEFVRPGLMDRVLMGGSSGLGFIGEEEVRADARYPSPLS